MTTELTWLGHGTWTIRTGDHALILDPFLTDNPSTDTGPDDVEADFVLISHGHFDHAADLVAVAKRTGATVIGIYEITDWCTKQGIAADKVHGMNIGGGFDFPFGRVKVTPALHSSAMFDGTAIGAAGGFLLELGGKRVYFACDTALFGDMALIGDEGIDLAVLPIGDNFTMGPADSVRATELLRPTRVAPAHYGTWPPIAQDAEAWAARIREATDAEPIVLEPGATITL